MADAERNKKSKCSCVGPAGSLGTLLLPAFSAAGRTAEEMLEELPEGYDEFFHDQQLRRPADPDFQSPKKVDDDEAQPVHHTVNAGYDQNYRDAAGRPEASPKCISVCQ